MEKGLSSDLMIMKAYVMITNYFHFIFSNCQNQFLLCLAHYPIPVEEALINIRFRDITLINHALELLLFPRLSFDVHCTQNR